VKRIPIKIKEKTEILLTSEISRKMASHAVWSLLGSVFSKILILVGAMAISRLLGKEQYGSLGIIRSTIQMFIAFAGFGIGATASKFIAENRDTNSEKTIDIYLISNGFSLAIGLVASILIFIFAPYIAIQSLHAPHLVTEIRIGGVIFLFSVLDGAQNGVLSGFEDFKSLAKTNILKGFTQVIFSILLTYYFGLKGAIIGFGLSFGVAWLSNFIVIRRHIKSLEVGLISRLKLITFKKLSVLWQFSLPAAISSMIMPFAIWWIKTLLVKKDGFEAMATYDVAEQWRTQILFIPAILSQIVLPMIANINTNGSSQEFKDTIKWNLILNVSTTTVLTIIIFFSGNYIMEAYGEGYLNTAPLYILAGSTILVSASNILFPLLMVYNKLWYGLYINIFWCICCIILAKIFLNYGLAETGLALSILFSYCISISIQGIYVWHLIKSKKNGLSAK